MPIYSARNPVPNVKQFAENLQKRLDVKKVQGGDPNERDDSETQDQASANRRTVVDPVTKSNVVIQDIKGNFEKSVRNPETTIPLANIEPLTEPFIRPNVVEGADMPAFPEGAGEYYRKILDDLAPPEANPTVTKEFSQLDTKRNVIYYPKPTADISGSFTALEATTTKITAGVFIGMMLLNFIFVGRGWRSILAGFVGGVIISVALHLWLKRLQAEANERNWETERARAHAARESLVPESVEWLNSIIATVWGLINPEMFQAVADTLEDVMQASVPPSVIENVKVADINQGTNPLKILSLRSLPDAVKAHKKGKEAEGDDKFAADQTEEELERKRKERALEDDPDSEYYNLEASFAYHALPAAGVASKAQNIHLEIAFYLGIKGLFGVPLPIFAELKGIVGTVRLRFQMTPNPPFVKNLTLTFMGLPKLSVSVVPMTQKGINVLNLPLISNFVDNAIGAAIDEYVAPKSLSMDISKLIEGDAIKKETDALGAIYIKIHDATGLPAMDKGGGSDTYITVAYSKLKNKPIYCTRVITKDLNPSWEEDTCVLVHREQVTGGEKLAIQLWDSDRFGGDDKVGSIEFDIHDIIENEGQMYQRTDTLRSDKDGKEVPGKLNWEIGFFSRKPFKKSMRTTGEDVRIPKELRGRDEFKDSTGVTNTSEEALAVNVPPDPGFPSGVLSVIIHEIRNLELERPKGTFGKTRPYSPAQIVGENKDEEGSNLPSSYCTVMINDVLAFKTRTKVNSSRPMFSAEVERFCRDWRNTVVTIAVRDTRHREHDPLIGAVAMKLSDVLQTSSQVTRSYALDGGVGYGMINVSVLFRSVSLQLPKNLLGWDVGSVEMMQDQMQLSITDSSEADSFKNTRVVMKTDVGSAKIKRSWYTTEPQGWHLKGNTIRIPVRQRYGSALRLEFFARGRRRPVAHAVQWLTDVNDNESTTVTLPLWKTKDGDRIAQNYADPDKLNDREHVDAKRIGEIKFTFRFKDGLDETHRRYLVSNDDIESMDAFEACLAEGSRRRIVRRETGATIKKLVQIGATADDDGKVLSGREPAEALAPILTPPESPVLSSHGEKRGTDADDVLSNESDYEDEEEAKGKHIRFTPGRMQTESEFPNYKSSADQEEAARLGSGDPEAIEEATKQEKDITAAWEAEVHEAVDSDYEVDQDTYRTAGDDSPSVVERDDLDWDEDDEDDSSDSNEDPDMKRIRKERKAAEKRQQWRKQRGIMQWKPARNVAFFKDELKIGAKRLKGKFGLQGRAPDVETEISQAQ